MFTLYFKQALRHLSRQKAFSCINILGLALSLACTIVLGRYIYRELNVDRHAIDAKTIYTIRRHSDRYHQIIDFESAQDQYDEAGRKYIEQQVIEQCAFVPYPNQMTKIGEQNRMNKLLYVDSTFTHFFNYEVVGEVNALQQNDACWISEACARSFGLTIEEALGMTAEVKQKPFRIAGVFRQPVGKTVLNPDFILPRNSIEIHSRTSFSLLRVRPDFDAEVVNQQLTTFGENPQPRYIFPEKFIWQRFITWEDYYFDPDKEHDQQEKPLIQFGNARLCWIFSFVLLLIFVVGVVNFINLFMVQWQRRRSEAGVRSVFGQQKSQLFLELWSELLLLILLSVLSAWILVALFAPWIETMLGDIEAGTSFDMLLSVGIIVLLPLLSLGYPFVSQLHHSPVQNLQQKVGSIQSLKTRTLILGFQYLITIGLVVMSLWMRSHLSFLLNSPSGLDADRVLLVRPAVPEESYYIDENGHLRFKSNRKQILEQMTQYIERLKQSPMVECFCNLEESNHPLTTVGENIYYNDRGEKSWLKFFWVPAAWFDVFGIRLQEGTFYADKANVDSDNPFASDLSCWVVNATALHQLGYQSLEGACARRKDPLFFTEAGGRYGTEMYPITGLVNDHYSGHRTLGTTACIYVVKKDEPDDFSLVYGKIAIRFNTDDKRQPMALIEQLQEELFPGYDADVHWMTDEIARQYRSDQLMADVYFLFSAIAVLICCLGLLGLSLFDIRQRYREIAIRKAHGAHRKDLYLLLGRKYIYVLLITFALSVPITYLFIHHYTESFVESAPLTPIIYFEALGIVSLITVLTLIYQLEKAARVNVASVMKTE